MRRGEVAATGSWDSPCGSNMASTVRRTPGFIVAHFASLRSPSDHFASGGPRWAAPPLRPFQK